MAASLTLSQRADRPELMDQPGLDRNRHRGALAGLRRLNLASGVCRQIYRELSAYSRFSELTKLRVLDIASGGGDVPFGVWKLAQRNGLDLQILGLDVSATACEYAAERCGPAEGAITFIQRDVTRESIPAGFDAVTCSLFLHHLTHDEAADLLKKMAAAARLLLVNDLRRCVTGYLLAQLACRLLTTSPVVRNDGPQSVANSFSLSEIRELCRAAELTDATIRNVWPCRLMIARKTR